MKKTIIWCSVYTILSANLFAGGDVITVTPVYEPIQQIEIIEDKMFYAYIMGGTSFSSIKDKNELVTFNNGALDDQGSIIDIGFGYNLSDDIFLEFSYQRETFDKNDINNFYASANYIYIKNLYRPYLGVLAGYSKLKWNSNPSMILYSFENTSESFLFGLQTGIEFPISEAVSVMAKYQFMKYEHVLDVRDIKSAISNDCTNNFLGGIKYEF